jgi:hypothetical protein
MSNLEVVKSYFFLIYQWQLWLVIPVPNEPDSEENLKEEINSLPHKKDKTEICQVIMMMINLVTRHSRIRALF